MREIAQEEYLYLRDSEVYHKAVTVGAQRKSACGALSIYSIFYENWRGVVRSHIAPAGRKCLRCWPARRES